MATREADRALQRFVRSARPVSFATGRTYTTSRDTTVVESEKAALCIKLATDLVTETLSENS